MARKLTKIMPGRYVSFTSKDGEYQSGTVCQMLDHFVKVVVESNETLDGGRTLDHNHSKPARVFVLDPSELRIIC